VTPAPAVAPAYQSIVGWKDCIGQAMNDQLFMVYCLPADQPDNCNPQAWKLLVQTFKGDKCVPKKSNFLSFNFPREFWNQFMLKLLLHLKPFKNFLSSESYSL
jgi:hypothetical protein